MRNRWPFALPHEIFSQHHFACQMWARRELFKLGSFYFLLAMDCQSKEWTELRLRSFFNLHILSFALTWEWAVQKAMDGPSRDCWDQNISSFSTRFLWGRAEQKKGRWKRIGLFSSPTICLISQRQNLNFRNVWDARKESALEIEYKWGAVPHSIHSHQP